MTKEKKNVPFCKSEAQRLFDKNFKSNGIKLIALFAFLLIVIIATSYVNFSNPYMFNSFCVILFGIGLAGLLGIPQLLGAKRLKKEDKSGKFDEDMSSYIRSLKVGGMSCTVLGVIIVLVGLVFLFINC